MILDQGGEPLQATPAVGGRHPPPVRVLGERGARRASGAVDVLGTSVGDLGQAPTGGRVKGLEGASVGGGDALSVDQQQVLGGEELAHLGQHRVGQGGGGGHGSSTIFSASRRS